MPDVGAALSGLGGAADSLFSGLGSFASAKGYKKAAAYADDSANTVRLRTAIEEQQTQRSIWRTLGGQQADVAGAGLAASGSALDLLRDSAAQGSLTKQLVGVQGHIDLNGYLAQADSYRSMAKSAKKSGIGKLIGSAFKVAAAVAPFVVASDDRLKEDIKFVERRPDGLGIYEYRFRGDAVRYRGVLASEVERLYPDAVSIEDGVRHVDYAAIGVAPELAEA